MRKKFVRIGLVILFVLLVILITIRNQGVSLSEVDLTEVEIKWIEEHPDIVYAGDPSWPPVDFLNSEGVPSGLAVDFLDLAGKKIGVEFIKTNVGNWDETIESIKNKEIDIVAASYNESRIDYMLFTPEIYLAPYIYVVRNDFKGDVHYEDIKTMRVATVAGWVLKERLHRDHEGVELVEYKTVFDALQAVSFGSADVLIQEIASVSYELEKNIITNLKSGGTYSDSLDIRFAVRNDYEILHGILSKVVNNFTESEKEAIISKWIKFNQEPIYKKGQVRNFTLGLIFLIVAVFIWTYILRLKVRNKTYELSVELDKSENMKVKLEKSIDDLKNLQSELINQEKLATLGSMVAGISHEINNPLGVCLTAVSTLESRVSSFTKKYVDAKMTKTDFESFIQFTDDCSQILRKNIDHSISILDGFKTLAIDQTYNEKVDFNICDYLNVINDNMKYELKKKQAKIIINCNSSVSILGFPGVFSQVFTNLIMNSLIHAFEERETENLITIDVDKGDTLVKIKFSDNGKGIEKESIENIFKMFYTTRRGQGGSGLGLYIVANIITDNFGGKITCESEIGKGTTFNITMSCEDISK